jgi:hypothetical protein
MKLTLTVGAALVALVVMVAGCEKAAEGPVLAKVNRSTITVADFKKQLEDMEPRMQQSVVGDPKARKEFLEDLIGIELVIQEAKRQGLDKTDEYKKRQDMLKKEMERRISEDAKNELFNAVLKKEIGEKLSKVAPPTDQEVKDYYAKNKEKIVAAAGKQVGLKEIESQLKMRILQERRRDLYLDFAKGLKAKAKVTVDDKVLDEASTTLLQPAKELDLSNLKAQAAPKKDDTKK